MPRIELNNDDPTVLDGRRIRAAAFEHAQRELLDTLSLPAADPQKATALTIGAGYSRLPQFLSDRGYHVTSIDPSSAATAIAQARPRPQWPTQIYQTAEPTSVPLPDDSIDFAWCIDTLEIANNPEKVLDELARVIRPSGLIVLDTLNDTALSRLIYLHLFQQLPGTRIMPPGRYTPSRFQKPSALRERAGAAGLRIDALRGYKPASPVSLVTALVQRRRNNIDNDSIAAKARFRLAEPDHAGPVTYYAKVTPR